MEPTVDALLGHKLTFSPISCEMLSGKTDEYGEDGTDHGLADLDLPISASGNC